MRVTKEKQQVIKKYCTNGKIIRPNVNFLREYFSELRCNEQKRNSIYKLQNFYQKIFQIHDIISESLEKNYVFPLDYLKKRIYINYCKLHSLYNEVIENTMIDIYELIEKCEYAETNGCIKEIKNLLYIVNNMIEELNTRINNHLKERRIAILYIFYHLSFLILHSIFSVQNISYLVRDYLEIYASFINRYHSIFSDVMQTSDFITLTSDEQMFMCSNENALNAIMSYLFLRMVKILLQEVDIHFSEFNNRIKEMKRQGSICLEAILILDELQFLENSFIFMKILNEMILKISENKYRLENYMQVNSIREEINFYLYRIIDRLRKRSKLQELTERKFYRILLEHKIILSLYQKFFFIMKNYTLIRK